MERKINNQGLGVCHILKQCENGYLLYSEDNSEHFIITSKIKDECFYGNSYYKDLDLALESYNNNILGLNNNTISNDKNS